MLLNGWAPSSTQESMICCAAGDRRETVEWRIAFCIFHYVLAMQWIKMCGDESSVTLLFSILVLV